MRNDQESMGSSIFEFQSVRRGVLIFSVLLGIQMSANAAAESASWKLTSGDTIQGEFLRIQSGASVFKLTDGGVKKVDLGSLDADSRGRASRLWNEHLSAAVKRIDEAIENVLREKKIAPNATLTDEQFARRVYLDITGTIPTYEQLSSFLADRDARKRFNLVSKLLNTEGWVSHTYNQFAELLRIQDVIPGTYLRTDAFSHWLKENIRANRPYSELVYKMLTASGRLWDDPASGFYLRDYETPLDHVQYTSKVLLGTDISCAQCHDDPFQDWTQMDYYRLTAFLSEVETKEQVQRPLAKGAQSEIEKEVIKRYKIDMKAKGAKEELRRRVQNFSQPIRWMTDATKLKIQDNEGKRLMLPPTYAYADGLPGDVIMPLVPFGNDPDYVTGQNKPRELYARWVTSADNPRFAMNIANRVWSNLFGRGVAVPLHNIDPESVENPELLKILEEEMIETGFDLKTFVQIITNTRAYNRISTTTKVTEAEPYYFQGPLLRRMSAEQVWDSLMTLMVNDPLRFRKGDGSYYYQVANVLNKEGPMSAREFIERATGYEKYSSGLTNYRDMSGKEGAEGGVPVKPVMKGKGEMMMGRRNKEEVPGLTYGDLLLARSSEIEQPAAGGHFLNKFGQSERNFVVGASSRGGSVPQVMEMMNGFATEIITKQDSELFKKMESAGKDDGLKADIVFMSILNRKTYPYERDLLKTELRQRQEGEAYSNLIWALLNTPEFFFIK